MAKLIDEEYPYFLVRRLLRIYPTYLVLVILVIFAKVLIFGSISQPQLFKALTLLPVGSIPYPLGVEWTLVYEIFFYFVCSIFTIRKLKEYFPYFLVIWLVVIILGNYYYKMPTLFLPTIDKIFFSLFNICFITGGISYHLYKRTDNNAFNNWVSAFVLLMLCTSFYIINSLLVTQKISAFIGYTLLGFLMGLFILSSVNIKLPENQGCIIKLKAFGDMSYALYLIHVPIITIMLSGLSHYQVAINSGVGIIILMVVLVFSWHYKKCDIFFHDFFKKKLLSLVNKCRSK